MGKTISPQQFHDFYAAFNRRDIEVVLASVHDDVQWANGMEGGFIHGRDRVREYWKRQFEQVQPELAIMSLEVDDRDRVVLQVQQRVSDLQGTVLQEQLVGHRFTLDGGVITVFEIVDAVSKPANQIAE